MNFRVRCLMLSKLDYLLECMARTNNSKPLASNVRLLTLANAPVLDGGLRRRREDVGAATVFLFLLFFYYFSFVY